MFSRFRIDIQTIHGSLNGSARARVASPLAGGRKE